MTDEQQYIVSYLRRLARTKAAHRCYHVEAEVIERACEFLSSLRDANLQRIDERSILFTIYDSLKIQFYNKLGTIEFEIRRDEITCKRKSLYSF